MLANLLAPHMGKHRLTVEDFLGEGSSINSWKKITPEEYAKIQASKQAYEDT